MKNKKLYRAVSEAEWEDYKKDKRFRTTAMTLEAKQFFTDMDDVKQYVSWSNKVFIPPYTIILEIEITEIHLQETDAEEEVLDTMRAYTIDEKNLDTFNNLHKFVGSHEIDSNI
jgi:hypothetical protein